MMKKIDEAIQIMGKTSQNISKMLAVHEEKLENTNKNDEIIFDRIRSMEVKNTEEHSRVINKIEGLEDKIGLLDKKVDEIAKFRWLIVGGLIIISFAFSQSTTVVDILTPDKESTTIERTK
jgi:hypothetical protein